MSAPSNHFSPKTKSSLAPSNLAQLDADAIDDIRLALNQSQPLGNERFYQHIRQMTGQRREGKPRGRPRKASEAEGFTGEQGEFEL